MIDAVSYAAQNAQMSLTEEHSVRVGDKIEYDVQCPVSLDTALRLLPDNRQLRSTVYLCYWKAWLKCMTTVRVIYNGNIYDENLNCC